MKNSTTLALGNIETESLETTRLNGEVNHFDTEISPSTSDINWFDNALNSSRIQKDYSQQMLNGIIDVSDGLKTQSEALNKRVQSKSTSLDYVEIMDTMRAMSNYGLQVNLTAKIVNKGSKAIERLTNLQ